MRLDPKRCPVVLVGSWNRSIFLSPQWVMSRVFRGEGDSIELGFDFLSQRGFSYRTSSVEFQVLAGQVRVLPLHASAESRKAAANAACKVLNVLKETPVSAVGINFGYDTDAAELKEFLSSRDQDLFRQGGWPVQQVTAGRKIPYDDQGVLGIVLLRTESGSCRVDLNFHWEVPDATTAEHRVCGHVEGAYEHGLRVLERVYNLKLEG